RDRADPVPPADLAERQPALHHHAAARRRGVARGRVRALPAAGPATPARRRHDARRSFMPLFRVNPYNPRMDTKTLPVALVQERNHGSAEDNLAVIEQRVAEAARQGAKLVLLQELHNGPSFCQHESVDEFDLAETIPGPSTGRLSALARRHGVVLVGSLFEKRATGLYHNTAVVFDADGSTAGRYRKMHIPDDPGFYEKFYFTPGDLGFEPIDT